MTKLTRWRRRGDEFHVGTASVVEPVDTTGMKPCCLETLVVARKDAEKFACRDQRIHCTSCGETIVFDGEVWYWEHTYDQGDYRDKAV